MFANRVFNGLGAGSHVTITRAAPLALAFLLPAWAGLNAQTSASPTIDAVTSGDRALTISWSAPAGVTGITRYDLRHIPTAADETVEANWTVVEGVRTRGALRHVLAGLTNAVEYDLQVRAVAGDAGAWSETVTGAPAEAGDTLASAAALTIGVPFEGFIDAGDDVDWFEITVAEREGLWFAARSELDTVGELWAAGERLTANDDSVLSWRHADFFLRRLLEPGTYHVKVGALAGGSGRYRLDTGTIGRPQCPAGKVRCNAPGVGKRRDLRLGGAVLGYFAPGDWWEKYSLLPPWTGADLLVYTVADGDVWMEFEERMHNSWDRYRNQDSGLATGWDDTIFRRQVNGLWHRVEITPGFSRRLPSRTGQKDYGAYEVHAHVVRDPGTGLAGAVDLPLGGARGGRTSSADDKDYFRLTVTKLSHVVLRGMAFGEPERFKLPIRGKLVDSMGADVRSHVSESVYGGERGRNVQEVSRAEDIRIVNWNGYPGFQVSARLTPGTYYLEVRGDGASKDMAYAVSAAVWPGGPAQERLRDGCAALDTESSDPYHGCGWHLRNTGQFSGLAGVDINVEPAWRTGNLGEGIRVAIVDNGLDSLHEDLAPNVDAARNHDYAGSGMFQPDLRLPGDSHGTEVAGLLAARDNGIGGRGVAPRARIHAYNLTRNFTDANAADAMGRESAVTAVSNNSWGLGDGPELSRAPAAWEAAIAAGISEGYGGLGVFYVFSAGNGFAAHDWATLDEHTTHHGVTSVCAVNDRGVRAAYSEVGPSVWVCAPSSDTGRRPLFTTKNHGRYGGDFGGTSGSAPIVSGVAALIRKENPALTWRDVKLILAGSARKVDPGHKGWRTGARKYGGVWDDLYEFNDGYGFGVVDAAGAVNLARTWRNLPAFLKSGPFSAAPGVDIPHRTDSVAGVPVESRVTVDSPIDFIEHVDVIADFDADDFRELLVELVSPAGAVSRLSQPSSLLPAAFGGGEFRFGTSRHLGEHPDGVWTLRVRDANGWGQGLTQKLESWSLVLYGHAAGPGVTVSFGQPNYRVSEGGTATVAVHLSADAERRVAVPLVARHLYGATEADHAGIPEGVVFETGERSVEFSVAAVDDTADDDGEAVVLSFGSLPAKVDGGAATLLEIVDNDAGGGPGGGPGSGGGGGGGDGGVGGGAPPPGDDQDGGSGGSGSGGSGSGAPSRAAISVSAECADGLCRARAGAPLRFEDASTGAVRMRLWDFGDGRQSRSGSLNHAWTEPGFREVSLWVSDGSGESTASLTFLVEAGEPAGTCEAGAEARCLGDSRYTVSVEWRTADGGSGPARVVRSGTNDTGLFAFFDPANWEVLVKVLDGCAVNGHRWVFVASTTDLGYTIRIVDTATGAVREYRNEPGARAPAVTDVTAFRDGCAP